MWSIKFALVALGIIVTAFTADRDGQTCNPDAATAQQTCSVQQ